MALSSMPAIRQDSSFPDKEPVWIEESQTSRGNGRIVDCLRRASRKQAEAERYDETEEIMIHTFQRYEKKFLMEESVMRQILPQIDKYMSKDIYCREGSYYPVSNLYYDTSGDDVIRESLQKPYYKEKLRMRSYGIPQTADSPVYLELKKKVDGIVTKRRAGLTYGQAQTFLQQGQVRIGEDDYLTRQVLREIAYYLSHEAVYAASRISYERLAYFSRKDESFRLTFDRNLRYLKAERAGQEVDFRDPAPGRMILPEHLYLMEVKVSDAYPLWFAHLLNTDGVIPVSFSKYGASYKTELIRGMKGNTDYLDILSQI